MRHALRESLVCLVLGLLIAFGVNALWVLAFGEDAPAFSVLAIVIVSLLVGVAWASLEDG